MDEAARVQQLLQRRDQVTANLGNAPYDLVLYLERADVHTALGFPDLAAGDAYRALLLADEAANDGFEYHDQAVEALTLRANGPLPHALSHAHLPERLQSVTSSDVAGSSDTLRRSLVQRGSLRAYQILSLSLLRCDCLRSAARFCQQGRQVAPGDQELADTHLRIRTAGRRRLGRPCFEDSELPDQGLVRREIYPWNRYEPDRFSSESLHVLNSLLKKVAPKCAVRISTLPALSDHAGATDGHDSTATCKQLGVFADEDIEPGETVLHEYSLLTANNRLKDSVCDACSSELPPLGSMSESVNCAECDDTVFCSQYCHDDAQRGYHPAVCEKDVDAIAKDSDAIEADETLYLLLLARVLALAAHQDIHPLDVREVSFIWGDFQQPKASDYTAPSPDKDPPPHWTLPFSFKYHIETPLHVLEKMDVDMYAGLARYDLWVLNTLYAKFRGTASARKNPRDGRPDVSAVHPFWCLANHDCDPNVTWHWGGRMLLKAREQRLLPDKLPGIRSGQEILNHYCDISLPVQQRREWARGSLGGWCMCERCRSEAVAVDEPRPVENDVRA